MISLSSRPERFLDEATLNLLRGFTDSLSASQNRCRRTYAVGDVHGCADHLVALLSAIEEAHEPDASMALMFLGDLIDRGPASAEVVAIVRALEDLLPAGSVTALRGNHEQMLLDWLQRDDDLWIENGAIATMDSFGLAFDSPSFPDDVIAWLDGLPTWHEDEAHIYVHAGLRPGRSYKRQRDDDRLWIREPFLSTDYDFGKHVIHGHTPVTIGDEPRRFRTNIDTGAVYGGALTAAVIDSAVAAPVVFLQTGSFD
jgi:serine/threonine protein phosphatase 1